MKFYKGIVDGVIDSSESGAFLVNLLERGIPTSVPVTYVSPFFDPFRGGVLTPPVKGAEVLVMYDESLGEYFYMGTIVGKPKFVENTDVKFDAPIVGNKRAYNDSGAPSVVSFTNSDGAGLKVNNYLGGTRKPLVKSVVLETTMGHRLELGDTPSRDQVSLKNRNQEGIIITASKTQTLEERCIDIRTLNSIRNTTVQGEYRVDLIDGRDITIKNSSSGMKGGSEIDTPFGAFNPIPAGNLNLVTKFKDINIYTEELPNVITGQAGRVLISTPQGVIQLKSGSDGITIYSEGKINIASVSTFKPVVVQSLGNNELTNLPNSTATFDSWLVTQFQQVNSGDTIALINVGGADAPKLIPIKCPYKGSVVTQSVSRGDPVTLFLPVAIIQTDGGSINMQASEDINLYAGGRINLNANNSVNLESINSVNLKSSNLMNLNSVNPVTIQSSEQVLVQGPLFTLGTINSNINQYAGDYPVYAPSTRPAEPVVPSTPPLPIIPEVGFYALDKQP
jgi:hypothetical protein